MTETELYHAGVKGMKWGVRKDKDKNSGASSRRVRSRDRTVSTTVKQNKKSTTISSRSGKQKAKLTVSRNRGMKLVAKTENANVKVIVSNTANIAAGALRVAAAFIPGASVLNGVATAATLVGTVANIKK